MVVVAMVIIMILYCIGMLGNSRGPSRPEIPEISKLS